jgi:hypothetical protein
MWLSRAFSTWADDVPLGVHRSGALGGRQAAFEGVGHPVAGVFVGDGQAPLLLDDDQFISSKTGRYRSLRQA